MKIGDFKKKIAILVLTSISIIFACTGCFIFSKDDDTLPDWRVSPTAIVNSEMALAHVAELLELSEDFFFADSDAGEITAVTAESSRITGFVVSFVGGLWEEDVAFFLVTRDSRVYYNIGGEEVRNGVFLISRYEEDIFTEREIIPEPSPDEPDVGDDVPGVPSDVPDVPLDDTDDLDEPTEPDDPVDTDIPDEPTEPDDDDPVDTDIPDEPVDADIPDVPDGLGGLGDLPLDLDELIDWLIEMLGELDEIIEEYGDLDELSELELLYLLEALGLYELYLFGG